MRVGEGGQALAAQLCTAKASPEAGVASGRDATGLEFSSHGDDGHGGISSGGRYRKS